MDDVDWTYFGFFVFDSLGFFIFGYFFSVCSIGTGYFFSVSVSANVKTGSGWYGWLNEYLLVSVIGVLVFFVGVG